MTYTYSEILARCAARQAKAELSEKRKYEGEPGVKQMKGRDKPVVRQRRGNLKPLEE